MQYREKAYRTQEREKFEQRLLNKGYIIRYNWVDNDNYESVSIYRGTSFVEEFSTLREANKRLR